MSRRKSEPGYSLNLLFRFSSQKDTAAIPHATSGFNDLITLLSTKNACEIRNHFEDL